MTLDQLVERERTRVRTLVAVEGALTALAVAGALLGVGIALFGGARWIALPAPLPALTWVLALAGVALVAWHTRRALEARASRTRVAAAIEHEGAMRAGAVRGALEIGETGPLGARGAALVARQLAERGTVLAPGLRRRERRRGALAAAGALAVLLVAGGVGAGWPDGWRALAHPVDAWRGTLLPALRIDAPHALVRGERLTIHVEAPGRRTVTLFTRARGRAWSASTHPVRDGFATATMPPLDADLAIVAADGRATSDTVQVRVTDRPFVGDVGLRAVYPAYLGRAAEPLAVGEPLRVPQGTVLVLQGRASATLRAVALVRGADTARLTARGHRFDGRVAAGAGRWEWRADGLAGPIVDVPVPLDVEVIPDSAPRVALLDPARDTTVSPRDRVSVAVEAVDDHGLRTVALRVWKVGADGRVGAAATLPLASATPGRWTGETAVELEPYQLVPGEALHLQAEVVDASPWAQRATSVPVVLRVPDLAAQREAARRAADSTVAAAAAAAGAQKQLAQRTGEAARARGDRGGNAEARQSTARGDQSASMSYESAERAKALAREQRDLVQRVEEVRKAAQQLERQLRQAGALDSALQGRLREAQQLLRDALTPELAQRLRELEEAAQKMNADASRQAMSELGDQQQRLREQLEKSVEMLRRAALEGAMQTLRDDARELASRQRALADTMSRDAASREASRDASRGARGDSAGSEGARQLAERARKLTKDIDALEKRLRQEEATAGAQRVAQAETHAQRSAEEMAKAARTRSEQASQGRQQEARAGQRAPAARTDQPSPGTAARPDAPRRDEPADASGRQGDEASDRAQSARDAASEMEQAAERLSDARERQIAEWKQELTQDMDRAIQEMLQLAREEEALAEQVQQSGNPAESRAQQSSVQQGVQQAGQRLQQAGRKSSHVSGRTQRAVQEAGRRVAQATQRASESGSAQQTASAMREAASALNQAAASLVRDRERANSSSSASGFGEMLEQMRKMGQQQGALNAQAQALASGQPGSDGQGGQPSARSLAKGQREIARSLEELGGGQGQGAGRADALAKEAEELARALERQGPSPETLERQQRLYRRLLDAGRAMEQDERDESGKREARAGDEGLRFDPGSANAAGRAATRFREPSWTELRGLSAEERRLVLEYFKRINASTP